MNQVTVTDIQEVALMETDDIIKWISMHQKSLKDDKMAEYHNTIKEDLEILKDEYNLRNPLVVAIKELTKAVDSLKENIKGEKNGNVKN